MIELRKNAQGKYVMPGPPAYGRIYRVVDQSTGAVGYNFTSSDLPGLDPDKVKTIESYDTFAGWATEIMSIEEVKETCQKLNTRPTKYVETVHTKLVARVRHRLETGMELDINGIGILDDMREMYLDLMGRHVRPPNPGWEKDIKG